MGYYRGDYYRGDNYHRGDYYRGDFLGIGGALKKAAGVVKSVGKAVLGVASASGIPVVSQAAKVIAAVTAPTITTNGPSPYIAPMTLGGMSSQMGPAYAPVPGIGGAISRLLPGGETGYYKRRSMNMTNVKALRRAGRRVKGFLRIAQRLGALPVNRGKGKRLFKRKTR